jgi:hypothetical protein
VLQKNALRFCGGPVALRSSQAGLASSQKRALMSSYDWPRRGAARAAFPWDAVPPRGGGGGGGARRRGAPSFTADDVDDEADPFGDPSPPPPARRVGALVPAQLGVGAFRDAPRRDKARAR